MVYNKLFRADEIHHRRLQGKDMKMNNTLIGILAIIAGVLVLWMPSLLTWIIGIFLIVYGIMALTGKK